MGLNAGGRRRVLESSGRKPGRRGPSKHSSKCISGRGHLGSLVRALCKYECRRGGADGHYWSAAALQRVLKFDDGRVAKVN